MGFSKDGKKIAYSISESGSDWKTIKIMDVESKEMFPEQLTRVKFSGTVGHFLKFSLMFQFSSCP